MNHAPPIEICDFPPPPDFMTCASVMASHDDPPRDTEVESRKSNIRAIGVPSIGPNFLQASPGRNTEMYSRSSSRSSKLTSHKLRDAS